MQKFVLLLGRERSYLTDQKTFSCKYGTADLRRVKIGEKIKIGKESFVVIKPSTTDFLFLRARRGPQVILPKDFGVIVSETGCGAGWRIVEGGAGSGFLSIQLANIGCEVYSYEKKKEFFEKAKWNTENSSLKNIKIKNLPVEKAKEKNIDLICLDLENPVRAIEKLKNNLKLGGWVAVYSMHVEQARDVFEKLEKLGFVQTKIVETIRREWKTGKSRKDGREMTRPKTHMLGHTGFLVFGRKI